MPTIDERCYGYEPAHSELLRLRKEIVTLKRVVRMTHASLQNFQTNIQWSRILPDELIPLHQMESLIKVIDYRTGQLVEKLEEALQAIK